MCKIISESYDKINKYFKNRIFEIHFFWILGFSKKYYAAYRIISKNKRRNRGNWMINNLVFPILVILTPFILKIVSDCFKVIEFQKSYTSILIGGSLTLLGINIIRTSSTIISEKLNYENVPSEFQKKISDIDSEIGTLKKRLNSWSWVLSFLGSFLYFLQVGLLINDSHNAVYWFVAIIILVFLLSLFFGRFISLMETNLFEKEEFTKLLFSKLITLEQDYNELESTLTKQGL